MAEPGQTPEPRVAIFPAGAGRAARALRVGAVLAAGACLALSAHSARAASAAADVSCVAAKLKASAKFCRCVLKAEQKGLGAVADTAKCESKLADAFAKAEAKAAGECRTSSDAPTVGAWLVDMGASVADDLGAGDAASRDAAKCVGRKLKAAGKACACDHDARRKELLLESLTGPDTEKCDAKLSRAMAKADEKGGGACPAGIDTAELGADVTAAALEVEADLLDLGADEFSARGPHGVGRRAMTLVDSSRSTPANGEYPGAPDRTLEITVYFPADRPTGAGTSAAALVFAEGGPLPLVIRAHGFSGFNADSTDLIEHLASHGYIVVSPNFPLSTLTAPGGTTILDLDGQAGDVSFLIDAFLAKSADPADMFFGRVDASRIGASGHSLGGATVLLAGYHPTLADPRIDAIIAFAPLACSFTESFYDGGTAPLLVVGGEDDLVTPFEANHLLPYTLADPEKYLVAIEHGTHTGFIDSLLPDPFENPDEALACPFLVPPGEPRPVPPTVFASFEPDFLGGAAAGFDTDGTMCAPLCPLPTDPVIDQRIQTEIMQAGALAFFDSILDGDVSADRLMTGRLEADVAEVTQLFEK